jgi:[acyl-carrier-protein] S-malonyltransferase
MQEGPVTVMAMFPGQGSLRAGAGLPWMEEPSSRVLDEVHGATGIDVRRLLTDAGPEELVRTDKAQIATFALSMTIAAAATERGFAPDIALGHSLGEYSALCFAGILTLPAAARLVAMRGAAMLQASLAVDGGMVAVLGVEKSVVEDALAGFGGLVIANENAPGQLVVAGPSDQIAALKEASSDLGLRKVLSLEVGGAFHSPLMEPAAAELDAALRSTDFAQGELPVVANIRAAALPGGPHWRGLLAEQLVGPVRFEESVRAVRPSTVVELGPGGVLAGLARRIDRQVRAVSVARPADLDELEGSFDG